MDKMDKTDQTKETKREREREKEKEKEKNREGKKKAVALRYDIDEAAAPRVLAQGQGRLAEKIIAIAQKEGIPLKEDQALTEALLGLDLYQEIPPELYPVVAEILAFVYSLDQEYAAQKKDRTPWPGKKG